MPKNNKAINNEKDKQIRESHIDTIIKNDKGNTLKDSILNNLWNHQLRKFNQSIRMNYKY